ncbi:hypothetical protein SAMN05444680_12511 [Variovorax sp. YR216]|nr:hypothetical protein SAMN05444680_12511 [Variovorax sp. YR216]
MRFLSFVEQLWTFWLPLVASLLLVAFAFSDRNLGMGVLGLATGVMACLFRVIAVGASKGDRNASR